MESRTFSRKTLWPINAFVKLECQENKNGYFVQINASNTQAWVQYCFIIPCVAAEAANFEHVLWRSV